MQTIGDICDNVFRDNVTLHIILMSPTAVSDTRYDSNYMSLWHIPHGDIYDIVTVVDMTSRQCMLLCDIKVDSDTKWLDVKE